MSQNVRRFAGCVSQGRTLKEALTNIGEAMELSLETRAAYKIATRVAAGSF